MTYKIFVTGGVVSSLGKGIASASLGALLKSRGYTVRIRKLDPYLNVDPGTMSPYQHGECFVTDDGTETDMDLGHYERFTNITASKWDNTTSGQLFQKIIAKERAGKYLGATVQLIPHLTEAIKQFILHGSGEEDFIICEVGGTVGDIEGLPFLEAIRQLGNEQPDQRMFIHLTLLPYIKVANELKTKPTQHSVRDLLQVGIQPDMLICRSSISISKREKEKLALFCNVPQFRIIQALDQQNIYDVVTSFAEENVDKEVLKFFHLNTPRQRELSHWKTLLNLVHEPLPSVRVAVVGKYVDFPDAYKSLLEAIKHGAWANKIHPNIHLISSEDMGIKDNLLDLSQYDGIIIPGGFGDRGFEGMINSASYARKHAIPFLGICLGMQAAVVSFARDKLHVHAQSQEFYPDTPYPVIKLIETWINKGKIQTGSLKKIGGTMRLGAYAIEIDPHSKIYEIYKKTQILERHRHRYEINTQYVEDMEKHGLMFSGKSSLDTIPEAMEVQNHPWYICIQAHPEFLSRPLTPHPLFVDFIRAIKK